MPVVVANQRAATVMLLCGNDDMAVVGCLKMATYSTLHLRWLAEHNFLFTRFYSAKVEGWM